MVLSKRVSRYRPQADLRELPAKLGGWLILLLFVSFHLYAIGVLEVGELSVAIWHVIAIIFSFVYFIGGIFLENKTRVSRPALGFFFLCTAFSLWIVVCAFSSPIPERGFTMVAMQIINLCVVAILVFNPQIELVTLNRRILKLAAGIGVIAIALYVPAILRYEQIALDQSLWMPSVGYYMEHGSVPRLIGLATDPNFYSLWMSIPLMVGVIYGRRSVLLWLPVALSVLMTLSRTFLVTLVFSSVLIVLTLSLVKVVKISPTRLLIVPAILITILFGYLSLIDINQRIMYYRTVTITSNERMVYADKILQKISENWNPITGSGLRSTQALLGGDYSHSTYLDILLETGLGGFLLWLVIYGFVGVVSLLQLRKVGLELIPWYYALISIAFYFVSFSLLYHPFVWMVMALIMNQCNLPRTPCSVDYGRHRKRA
jgi:O-antigen ligase